MFFPMGGGGFVILKNGGGGGKTAWMRSCRFTSSPPRRLEYAPWGDLLFFCFLCFFPCFVFVFAVVLVLMVRTRCCRPFFFWLCRRAVCEVFCSENCPAPLALLPWCFLRAYVSLLPLSIYLLRLWVELADLGGGCSMIVRHERLC